MQYKSAGYCIKDKYLKSTEKKKAFNSIRSDRK